MLHTPYVEFVCCLFGRCERKLRPVVLTSLDSKDCKRIEESELSRVEVVMQVDGNRSLFSRPYFLSIVDPFDLIRGANSKISILD